MTHGLSHKPILSALTLSLLATGLSACGGGAGASSVASTPTPAPNPTPTANSAPAPTKTAINARIDPPTLSETFNSLAARASGTSTAPNVTSSAAALDPTTQVSYDASTKTYRVTNPGPSSSSSTTAYQATGLTDPSEATGGFTFCEHVDSSCSGSRGRVTHTSQSGYSYQYVAAAVFVDFAGPASASKQVADAAVFGAPTLAASIPRTGSANYALDLLGYEIAPVTAAGSVAGDLKGTGTASLDFAAGTFAMNGTASSAATSSTATFSSAGQINSTSNGFTGTFTLVDSGTYNGQLNGWLFGPAGTELGAAFAASQTNGRVVAGTILGHH